MEINQEQQLRNILIEAVKQQAADIHFSVGSVPFFRVYGRIANADNWPVVTSDFTQSITDTLLEESQKKYLQDHRELIITHDFDKGLRFKISIFYQKEVLSISMRYVPLQVPTLDSLKLNPLLREWVKLPKGLLIVSGPFGSGRSTTAAALIEYINQTRKEYIITIEDPIEYLFTNKESVIEQRQVGRDTHSFNEALAYFQEEDGDILFLEDMHDPATIPPLLEIARGSALAITTISADSASKTIARILDGFTSLDQERVRNLLSSALKGIVCQKLLPRVGGGMIAVQEVLVISDAVRASISSGNISQIDNIIQTSRQEGMISFEQSLAQLVSQRLVSLDDALEQVNDRKQLENLLRQ